MFYRYLKSGARIATDLDGLFDGSAVFILGGSPKLAELPLDKISESGIPTLAMNNVPCTFPNPTLWVCADKPPCFSPHIYASAAITKFTMISRRDEMVLGTGKRVREFPNMFFFGTKGDIKPETFLAKQRDIAWWKSVFPIALQISYRLGFRRVYLVGCGFRMNKDRQYAWTTDLTEYQINYSQRTYNVDVDRLRQLKPHFESKGFEVISCTPDSAANGVLDYISVEEAIRKELETRPKISDTMSLVHSSALAPCASK